MNNVCVEQVTESHFTVAILGLPALIEWIHCEV